MKTKEQKQQQKEENAENKHSKKAFTYLVRMAKNKGALVSVEYGIKNSKTLI